MVSVFLLLLFSKGVFVCVHVCLRFFSLLFLVLFVTAIVVNKRTNNEILALKNQQTNPATNHNTMYIV